MKKGKTANAQPARNLTSICDLLKPKLDDSKLGTSLGKIKTLQMLYTNNVPKRLSEKDMVDLLNTFEQLPNSAELLTLIGSIDEMIVEVIEKAMLSADSSHIRALADFIDCMKDLNFNITPQMRLFMLLAGMDADGNITQGKFLTHAEIQKALNLPDGSDRQLRRWMKDIRFEFRNSRNRTQAKKQCPN